jgi:DNA adenine methylase
MSQLQLELFDGLHRVEVKPFKQQLLKWVGNKQRFAHEIISYFPGDFGTYYEPFLGSGAVLGTLAPKRAVAGDAFSALIGIWQTLSTSPCRLKEWYTERWGMMETGDKGAVYEAIKASYNANPNPADLLFLCRSCYGGVVRFRRADGYMSTPVGPHNPISPDSFSSRVDEWSRRTHGALFLEQDFERTMAMAQEGDIVYCDPPYTYSQGILYGAQAFDLGRLFGAIARCKERGVRVVLSIDGTKKSGQTKCAFDFPPDLFENEVLVSCGRSMLRRLQMNGQTLEGEVVADRLLLTY